MAVGGTGSDYAYAIKPTTDGGYAAAGGITTSAGGNDFFILKLDAYGSLQWSKAIGGSGDDGGFFIVQTSDGGYAAAGYTQSYGAGSSDFYIIKLDSAGSIQWSKTVGGSNEDVALAIVQTTDGGYATAGYTYSFGAGSRDFFLVKLNNSGSLQWARTIGGPSYDFAETLTQTSDGGYAIAGFTYSFGAGGGDFYIVKLDSAGTLQWSRTIGGIEDDYCLSVIQTTDGGYAVAGPSSSYGAGNNDFYIVKLTAEGSIQWTRTVGGTGLDYAECVIQTTDGGYAVGGLTYSFGAGNKDMFIVKLDSNGSLLWNRTAGGINDDYAESIVQSTDGGYAGAGHTNSFGVGNFDAYVVKFDASGNTCGNFSLPTPYTSAGGTMGNPVSTITSPSPAFTSPVPSISSGGTLTTICVVGIQTISNSIPKSFELYQNYPNPFNPVTHLRFDVSKPENVYLTIYNVQGMELENVVNEEVYPGTYEFSWDASSFASGVYFYKLTAGVFTKTKKMILLK